MPEIVNYLIKGASKITPSILEKILRHLPLWKLEFTQIKSSKYPHLSLQLQFFADAIEDFMDGAEKNLPYYAVAEAAFALIYAHKKSDIIPDIIPEIGYADDSSIVRAVLMRHEKSFAAYAERHGINWGAITSNP
ncbi:MAG: DUF1232 domain-containing protein [Verrucomicrobiae bacterium]|nr:DUF1232 domain-containing protein [Verrucomicrobiae bacterium]